MYSTRKGKQIIRRGSDGLSYRISPSKSSRKAMHFDVAATKLMNGTYNNMEKKNVAKLDNAVLE